MATTVIDTADWALIVPLKPALNLTGSRLTATMTGSFGGAPAAALDSANGSIAWTVDATGPSAGLSSSLLITVPRSARGAWSAVGANGLPGLVTLFFDVHRTVAGSTRDEWLGRSSVAVLPATDSAGVGSGFGGFQPVLTAAQPGGSATLIALQVGPQGPLAATPTVLATAAIRAGQPIVVTAVPPGAQPASSASFAAAYVEGLAAQTTAAGYPLPVERASLTLPDWSAVAGTAQLAIGRDYFLAPAGTLSLLPDAATGHCIVRVGRALSATTLILDVSPPFLI